MTGLDDLSHVGPDQVGPNLVGTSDGDVFISMGSLPPSDRVAELVARAHELFRGVDDGVRSDVYPALAEVSPSLFGLTVVSVQGQSFSAGDVEHRFTVMSAAKPFTFGLLCESVGVREARSMIGANATGLAFNSVAAIERSGDGRTNPMVNAGAIATVGALLRGSVEESWSAILGGMSRFAGRELEVDDVVYESAAATNHRNRSIAHLLHSRGVLSSDPEQSVELYTRISCLSLDTRDLAAMGAVLANGGVSPITGEAVVSQQTSHAVLAVMTTAGLYETSGDWLFDIGLPGKSGIAGGIVTVSPGKGALGTFSPLLDSAGNSVRGQLAATFLSDGLGLDIFTANPVGRPATAG